MPVLPLMFGVAGACMPRGDEEPESSVPVWPVPVLPLVWVEGLVGPLTWAREILVNDIADAATAAAITIAREICMFGAPST